MPTLLRTLDSIRIFTRDLDRSRHFYGGVLELDERDAASDYAIYRLGDINIVIEAVSAEEDEISALVGQLVAASFKVDDVTTAYGQLRSRGASFVQPPERQSRGGTLAFLHDPDGNILTLVGD